MSFREYALERWGFAGNSALCLYGLFVHNPQECNYPYVIRN